MTSFINKCYNLINPNKQRSIALLYQKIFTNEEPYHIGLGGLSKFPEHRHADFEFNFCIDGEFDIIIDKKNYHVKKGCTSFIPPMCAHEVPSHEGERTVLTLIVGMSLLNKHFKDFSRTSSTPSVYDLNTDEFKKIKELFFECAEIKHSTEPGAELLMIGNIYKILAYFSKILAKSDKSRNKSSDYRAVENIEKAIELIHYNYKEALTLEHVAELTGYSKSNFCKIFKKVVGESFHQALNRRRVECAAGLLSASNMSISDISCEVGFSETKAFCRVFKSVWGVTPGQYRKSGAS